MIIKTHGYKSSDGTIHGSLAEAQSAELRPIVASALQEVAIVDGDDPNSDTVKGITDALIVQTEKIIDILTMTSKSKPRARKINGGTKTRAKKSTRHEAEQFSLPMEDNPKDAA